jgi:hypothetical protein
METQGCLKPWRLLVPWENQVSESGKMVQGYQNLLGTEELSVGSVDLQAKQGLTGLLAFLIVGEQ